MIFNKKYQAILENYGSIKTVNRIFYPRNFNLSLDFVNAFKREFCRLQAAGIDKKRILSKMNKALHFHCRESENN